MRPAIAPTNHEIINELLAMPQISRMSKIRRLGRQCDLKNQDGDIIGAYEYLGYYFDSMGDIRGAEWYEYSDTIPRWIVITVLAAFAIVVLYRAVPDLLKMLGWN